MSGSPLTLISGTANTALAEAIGNVLGVRPAEATLGRFPDGELHVAVRDSLRGHDVFLVQPTGPPVERNLMELLFLADACRRAGAARLTAVIPYFGYARQERRAGGREPVGARLVANLLAAACFDRVVAVDLHSASLEGFFGCPLEHLTAVPLIAAAVAPCQECGVVVAPDLGATRLADRFARALELPLAIVHKTRVSGSEVMVRGLTGEVKGRTVVLVDDMISTGATIAAAAEAVLEAGAQPDLTVVATHRLDVAGASERLRALQLRQLIVTDSLCQENEAGLPLQVVSLAPLLADAIKRLHEERSLAALLVHG